MAGGQPWTPEQDRAVLTLPPSAYNEWAVRSGFPERGVSAILKRRTLLNQMGEASDAPRNVTGGYRTATPAPAPEAAGDVGARIPHVSVARRTVQHAPRSAQNGADLSVSDYDIDPDPPPRLNGKPQTDADWDDLFEHIERSAEARATLSESTKQVRFHAPIDGPIAIAFYSDLHAGATGVLYKQWREDVEALAATEGLYGVFNGDCWEAGKTMSKAGSALYTSIMSPKEEFEYVRRRARIAAGKWIVWTAGNHDSRDYQYAGIDRLPQLCEDIGAPYATEAGAAVTVLVGVQKYTIIAKHDYTGKSRISKSNSGRRLWEEYPHIVENTNADIVALAHLHEPDIHETTKRGQPVVLLRSGTYKTSDAYAESHGFKPTYGVPVVVLDPEERSITPFRDFRRGIRFLLDERRRWKSR